MWQVVARFRTFVACAFVTWLLVADAQTLAIEAKTTESPAVWDFYVSSSGNDAWSGLLDESNSSRTDGPFLTLQRARDAVRQLRLTKPDQAIRVAIRGGNYRLDQTLVFGIEDSASDEGSTLFAAYPGETPVISSGVSINGWKKVDVAPPNVSAVTAKNLWSAELPPSVNEALTLYDGLQRLPRARSQGFTPPHGWKDDGAGLGPANVFYFPDGILERYADFAGAHLHVLPTANYEMNVLPIAYVDRDKRFGITSLMASRAMGPMQFHDKTMWIENRLEDLDEPGEWVCDVANRKLYLWPRGEKPSDQIVAPKLTELVRVEGRIDYAAPRDTPHLNLTLRGLTFAHAERLPTTNEDGWGLQHCWETFDRPTALLRFRGAEGCCVEACRFVASGGAGMRMDLHCHKNEVRDCEFAHLGGVGVLLAGYGPGSKDVNTENSVTNNWVHHIGEVYWASPAIFAWQSGRNVISNNLVHNTPYTGIVVSGRIGWKRGSTASGNTVRWHELKQSHPFPWSWSEREPYMHGRLNRVERNEIHSVMEKIGDGNAIYVSGTGKGNILKENFIHNIDSDHMVQAIRCDDDQEETFIEKNVIYRVRSMHQGINIKGKNDVCNNYVIDLIPSRTKIDPRWRMHAYIGLTVNPVRGSKIQRNIIYSTDPSYTPFAQHRTYGQGDEPRLRDCNADFNLYFSPQDLNWANAHLKTEREFGIEEHSMVADPLFFDVDKCDLRLRADSPAHKLGIEPIDMKKIGLLPNHPFRVEEIQKSRD